MKTDEGYELIKGLIETGAANDPKVRSLLDRIAKGDADFKTTSEYSRIVSEILGTSLSEHILDLDGEAREEVCRMLLHDRYEDINDVLAEVQTSLDAKTGINIRPKKPPFQSERVASFAHSLADLTVADQVIKRRAKNGSANISMSDHDRYMKANAELRNKAGLKCYIERETDGKCCEWCTKMAGRYAYPDDTPKDVFRRHDNCGCSVTYKNGRQRQDVWSKKTWEDDKDERISKASGKEPTTFTKADAQAKQSEILAQRRLTYDGKRGIINTDKENGNRTIYGKISKNAAEYLKQLQNEGDFIRGKADDFTMLELAEMSRFTGVEFGKISFQLESIIVRGNEKGTTFPEDVLEEAFSKNGRFEYHSHPYDDDLYPSKSDEKLLALFKEKVGQNTSKIVAPNEKYSLFSCDGTAYIKSLNADNTIDEEYADELRKLFGGD